MTVYRALHIARSHPTTVLESRTGRRAGQRNEDTYSREDAAICLNCTQTNCRGGEKCFRNRKREAVAK